MDNNILDEVYKFQRALQYVRANPKQMELVINNWDLWLRILTETQLRIYPDTEQLSSRDLITMGDLTIRYSGKYPGENQDGLSQR